MREPTERELRAVARRHRPRGWRVVEGKPADSPLPKGFESAKFYTIAYCDFGERVIKTPKIDSRWGLYVFLHECGHANQQTARCLSSESAADIELEAERYAIAAMRAAGIPVPRDALRDAKRAVGDYVDRVDDGPSDEALVFANFR